ncbi:hypothetical protein H5410_037222 [Solanum commersonii]|uniref:Uncharacterized protein n=1 Tax=Solanum commersonii TaxID=4109 RepID=A0A9J5YAJ9_SOLCO|nr:hypothetical protein H5410_037222 [Solanum commersonii]
MNDTQHKDKLWDSGDFNTVLGAGYRMGLMVTIVEMKEFKDLGLTPPFQAKRGLRQGDSMSLYLSILAIVYLGREPSMLGHNGDFKFQPDAGNWVVFIYALLMIL